MFAEYQSSGKHMICDIKNIKNAGLLNDYKKLNDLMEHICKNFGFNVLGDLKHIFTPEGCSIIFLLSESHMTIHTFPERNYIAFDIYTCRQYEDDSDYIKIYNYLLKELDADIESSYSIVNRNFK